MLGHLLQPNGSFRACWRAAQRSMWRAFWANVSSSAAKGLPTVTKLALLQRAVVPLLDFRCSRWPPQQQIAAEVDRLQRKMAAVSIRLPRIPGEPVEAYVRRRGRMVAAHCRQAGLWSHRWFHRTVAWRDHLERPRNARSWASKTLHYMDHDWFCRRRALFGRAACTAGRTGTRTFPGCVHTRWHDGVQYAQEILQIPGGKETGK